MKYTFKITKFVQIFFVQVYYPNTFTIIQNVVNKRWCRFRSYSATWCHLFDWISQFSLWNNIFQKIRDSIFLIKIDFKIYTFVIYHCIKYARTRQNKGQSKQVLLHKQWSFSLRISSVNVTKSAVWSHLLKKSLMENFIFCAVYYGIFYEVCIELRD